jgi:hypothetical protein
VSPFEAVAVVIAAFFGFGIAMGVLIVVALPRRRRHPGYLEKGKWEEPPTPPSEDGKPPRWPGG